MKIYDTLVKVDINTNDEDSRIRNGKIYSWCHEQNAILKKNGEGEDKHFFVFSNTISNNHVICRSTKEPDELGMIVSYDTEKYTDFIVFSGNNDEEKKINRLSKKATRFVFNDKTGSIIKKVIATSRGGQRPINIFRTEFHEVLINDFIETFKYGIGGRLSYGCGLIIPSKVYSHLMNFVQK